MSEEISGSTVSATIKSAETELNQLPKVDMPQQADGSAQPPSTGTKTDGAQPFPSEPSAAEVADPAKDEEVLFEAAASQAETGTIDGEIASDHTGPAGISSVVVKPTVDSETPATATSAVDADVLAASVATSSTREPEGSRVVDNAEGGGAPAVEEGLPSLASESTTPQKADDDFLPPLEIATDELKPPGAL